MLARRHPDVRVTKVTERRYAVRLATRDRRHRCREPGSSLMTRPLGLSVSRYSKPSLP